MSNKVLSKSMSVAFIQDGQDGIGYRLNIVPKGIVVNTTTGDVSGGNIRVEVWRNKGEEAEHVDSLSKYGLTLTATAGGSMPDTSGERRTATVVRGSDDEQTNFESLLESFNGVLSAIGKTRVTAGTDTYTWLKNCYDMADSEWNSEDSNLFKESTYPLVYNYRGDNTEYANRAYNAMQSWLMASCLSELVPSTDNAAGATKLTNNQTKLFKHAWDYASGDATPLYGDYDVHADPMIARYAATMVYALMRGKQTFAQMSALRMALNGGKDAFVEAVDSEDVKDGGTVIGQGLGFVSGGNGQAPQSIGYMVNYDSIIPDAPGPYATGEADRTGRVKPGDSRQFYLSNPDSERNWYAYNYIKDVAIDEYICNNFQMAVTGTSDARIQEARDIFEGYAPSKQRLLLNAVTAPYCTKHFLYGSKRVKLDGISKGNAAGTSDYCFFKFKEGGSSDLLVGGPFADLQSVVFDGTPYGVTGTMGFIKKLHGVGDDCRWPIYRPEYDRRRRPLSGQNAKASVSPRPHRSEIHDSEKHVGVFGSKWDGIVNGTLSMMFADTASDCDKYKGINDWPDDNATSYPSGHAAQGWLSAMVFGQMYSGTNDQKIIDYAIAAYEFGVGRTVSRYHWNSDVIFGRLCATMILPIFNAMNGTEYTSAAKTGSTTFQAVYDAAKTAILGGVSGGITVVIRNNSGAAMTIKPQIRFLVRNTGTNTSVTTSRLSLNSGSELVTIPSGGSETFRGITLDSASQQLLGMPFAAVSQLSTPNRTYQSNILLYAQEADGTDNSDTYVVSPMDSSVMFTDNTTYEIDYRGYKTGTTSAKQNASGGVSTGDVTTTVTIVNNSGKAITFDGKVNFITYGTHPDEPYTGYFRFKGTCSGSDFTIPAGGRKTYTVVFDKNGSQSPAVGLGMPFASQAQRGKFKSNNCYYIGGSGYTCNDFSTSDTFREGGSYTMTIPTDTKEWSS